MRCVERLFQTDRTGNKGAVAGLVCVIDGDVQTGGKPFTLTSRPTSSMIMRGLAEWYPVGFNRGFPWASASPDREHL
jgi:hypothetical protein